MQQTEDGRPDPFAGDPDPRMGWNRVWFNLLRIQRSMGPRIARVLRAEGLEDPVWFEILVELERAGPEGLPMAELERMLYVPQYALSRHAARLEAVGWVRGAPRPGPGRGRILALSEAGIGMHERIWPVYRKAIEQEIGVRMSTDDAYVLARMLIRLYP